MTNITLISKYNPGYCLAESLKNYSIQIEPWECFLLSNPLYIGFQLGGILSKQNDEISDCVLFENPNLINNFSVNTKSLLVSFHRNDPNHKLYIVQRLLNHKKTIVRLSDRFLKDKSCSNKCDSFVHVLLTDIRSFNGSQIDENQIDNNTELTLELSNTHSTSIPLWKFIECWSSTQVHPINTNWYLIIPPKISSDTDLTKRIIEWALVKEFYKQTQRCGTMLWGVDVVRFFDKKLKTRHTDQDLQKDTMIWKGSLWPINYPFESYRNFSFSLDCFFRMYGGGGSTIVNSFNDLATVWDGFQKHLEDNPTISPEDMHYYYSKIIDYTNYSSDKLGCLIKQWI